MILVFFFSFFSISSAAVTFGAPRDPRQREALVEAQDLFEKMKVLGDQIKANDRKIDLTSAQRQVLNSSLQYQWDQYAREALHKVITGYDIKPDAADGTFQIENSPKSPAAKWHPTFAPVNFEVHIIKFRNAEGRLVTITGTAIAEGLRGWTFLDGTVRISRSAFEYSPAFLAGVVLHESRHYEQVLAGATRFGVSRMDEELAYKYVLDNAAVLGLSPQETALVRSDREQMRNRIDRSGGATISYEIVGHYTPTDPDAERIKSQAERALIGDGANAADIAAQGRRIMSDALEKERQDREAQQLREAQERVQREQDDRDRPWFDYLSSIAGVACNNPNGFASTFSKERGYNQGLESSDVLRAERFLPGSALGACERFVLQSLFQRARSLICSGPYQCLTVFQLDEAREFGIRYRQEHPAPPPPAPERPKPHPPVQRPNQERDPGWDRPDHELPTLPQICGRVGC